MHRNKSILWRVAKDTFKQKYSPIKVKERVESTLYLIGLILLLLFILIVAISLVTGAIYGSIQKNPSEAIIKNIYQLKTSITEIDSQLTSIEALKKALSSPIETLVFILMLYIAIGFVKSVFFAWRRHKFEETHSSSDFRVFVHEKLEQHLESSLFIKRGPENSKVHIPMAPIPTKNVIATLSDTIQHTPLPSGWIHFLKNPIIGLTPLRHWLMKSETIRWPNRVGFSAKSFNTDLTNIDVTTCLYKEDIDTAYALGFAYYIWFNRQKNIITRALKQPAYLRKFWKSLEEWTKNNGKIDRKNLSGFLNQIFKPDNPLIRTQLGVQALVVFNDYSDGGTPEKPNWKVLIQKRSNDVASCPNHIQFIPSGGFESHQTYDGNIFDELKQSLLQHECKIERGLFREFAEEVIGQDEFTENESLDPDDVYRETGIKSLRDILKKGELFMHSQKGNRAALFTLGISLSLIAFKAEVSHLLIIDHPDYFVRHRIKRSSSEAHMIFTWELSKLGDLLDSRNNPPVDSSIALLRLFLDDMHADYRSLLNFTPDEKILRMVGLN